MPVRGHVAARRRTRSAGKYRKAAGLRGSSPGTDLARLLDMLRRPVEDIRPDRFRPAFCPRRECPAHVDPKLFRYRWESSYRRACDPRRRIRRFRCRVCGRTSSRQSFAATYYLKRPELLAPVAAGLVAGSAHRQIARSLGCAPSTVTRLAARIGRHSLLLQARLLEEIDTIDEPVVLDHFETFVYSQDDRLGIATSVGQSSWFVYGIQPAPHRRAGKRSARKRAPRHRLPTVPPGSVVRSTLETLDLLVFRAPDGLTLVSDDHPAYRTAVARHRASSSILHRVYPNPSRGPGHDRERARERDRQMGPVDVFHKLWRHSQAHHRRETIAFGRRSNAVLERAALMVCWKNLVKGVSERRNDRTTPAMRLGLTARPWMWRDVFARRLFPGRIRLSESWMRIYCRAWITPAVGRNVRHELRHAF